MAVAYAASFVGSPGGVSLLVGNGDGTFQPRRDVFTARGSSNEVAVGDFNGDGTPDLAVANSPGVSVVLGNGDGTFQAPLTYATTAPNPSAVVVGDFNGDGIPDLAVANLGTAPNYTDGNVSVLLGNGDGTFQAPTLVPAGDNPQYLAIGDFNGDSTPDLAVSFMGGARVLLGNGDGTFQASGISYVTGRNPSGFAVGDFNGDGRTDLAVTNYVSNNLTLLLNDGLRPHRA